MLDGEVIIDLIAPNKPFITIDYAFLHTEATAALITEPGTLFLLLGDLGFYSQNHVMPNIFSHEL